MNGDDSIHNWHDEWASVFGVEPMVLQPGATLIADVDEPSKVTSAEIVSMLTQWYIRRNKPGVEAWACFPELRESHDYAAQYDPGYSRRFRYRHGRRIDLWAIGVWKSTGYERIAYEVKVSRSDFLAELKEPEKRRPALDASNRFYFATPPKLIRVNELPAEAGLVEVHPNGRVHFKVRAPYRKQADVMPLSFVAAVMRRAFRSMLAAEPNGLEVGE